MLFLKEEIMNNNNQIISQVKERLIEDYSKEPSKLIDELVHSISVFLSGEIDFKSFDKYRRTFELDCRKALNSIFISLYEKEPSLLIFPDVIPGFTTIIYKKDAAYFKKEIKVSKNKASKIDKSKSLSIVQDNPLNIMLSSFFEKNSQMILSIESTEITMMLCPVNDLDKYFKELELYS